MPIEVTGHRVIDTLPGSLPTSYIPHGTDPNAIASAYITNLENLHVSHLTKDAIWRDLFALTGTTRTFYSASGVITAWKDTGKLSRPNGFKLVPSSARVVRHGEQISWVEAGFTFQTKGKPSTTCSGFVSFVPDERGGWKIWLIRTILEQLQGQPNVDALKSQPQFQISGPEDIADPYGCVVVGGGQAGLAISGRLKALGVPYVLIEKNARIRDNWGLRYESAKPHLPFERTFTPDFPEFLDKNHVGEAHEAWAKKFGINAWLSTTIESGSWNDEKKLWTLRVVRDGQVSYVRTKHIALAIGTGGQIPMTPNLPGREKFKGSVLHSADYRNSDQWTGKAGVVIGAANTAHDIAGDMVAAKLSSATMVQRGQTYVLPIEFYHKFTSSWYNDTVPTELADRARLSDPLTIASKVANHHLHPMTRAEPGRFDALERVGFKVERYGDSLYNLNEKGGSHYMDTGGSAMVSGGLIKVKSDAAISRFDENGLVFHDGSKLKADVVIFATGFVGTIRGTVSSMLGQAVADQVEEFWGLNSEGELNGAYRPIGHPGLWYAGGSLAHARFLSRFIALQVKADLIGTPLSVYQKTSGEARL